MSRLRKREHGSETGAASAVMDISQNNIRLRLKVEIRMAVPFLAKRSFGHAVDKTDKLRTVFSVSALPDMTSFQNHEH
jgi:hypothetical protein